MDGLLTIILRLYYVTGASPEALGLLRRARSTTLRWMTLLRQETQGAKDAETARRCQSYTLWAAYLCKRTYGVHADEDTLLDAESLGIFIRCSITLQSSLVEDPKALPKSLLHGIVRDYKMSFAMRDVVKRSAEASLDAFVDALSCHWPVPAGRGRTATGALLEDQPGWLVTSVAAPDDSCSEQTVSYNYIHGLLLVDGMPLGQLPQLHQKSGILRELFGGQNLLAYPSSMRGMTYTLNIVERGWQVHLGFDGDAMVVRACDGKRVMEFIPRAAFGSYTFFDLPSSLVENQFHWLDFNTGTIDIRPKTVALPTKQLVLDVNTKECVRRRKGWNCPTVEYIVDPHTQLSHRIARTFEGFEPRHHITIFQRTGNRDSIVVDLRRMQLTFTVNNHALFSPSSRPRSTQTKMQEHGMDSTARSSYASVTGSGSCLCHWGTSRPRDRAPTSLRECRPRLETTECT